MFAHIILYNYANIQKLLVCDNIEACTAHNIILYYVNLKKLCYTICNSLL